MMVASSLVPDQAGISHLVVRQPWWPSLPLLGSLAVLAVPTSWYSWGLISVGMIMVAPSDSERRGRIVKRRSMVAAASRWISRTAAPIWASE